MLFLSNKVLFALNLWFFGFKIFKIFVGALKDLDKAIELAYKYQDNKVLSLAMAQKGSIFRLQNKDSEALECFKIAADKGNRFARQQCVSLNPYAALCNQMLSDMFAKVKRGEA